MSRRRGILYIVAAAALALGYCVHRPASVAPLPEEPDSSPATVITTLPPPAAATYRAGWPELPAERQDEEIYYTRHLFCAADDSTRSVRNYTACYSRRYRCPLWVAAPQHASYRGTAKRSGSFRFDPTLPIDIQPLLSRSYGDYTRGHLLASADRTATVEANRQTFYASNISPQLQAGFNAGNGAWNNLEAFVDRQVCADTLYVVTGCIFTDYTDSSGRTAEASVTVNRNDGETVAVPTAFYKALLRTREGDTGRRVTECAASELKCAAFVVAHTSAKGRKPSVGDMMSIAELERLTGERLFANVPAAPKADFSPRDWGL